MRICEQSAIILLLDTIKMLGVINVSSAIIPIFSLIALIMYGEIQLSVPVLFPFTDLETIEGFTINLVNQLFIGIVGLAGSIGIEILTCVLKDSVWITTAAISYAVDEISEKIEDPVLIPSEICIDNYFRNILAQVQDFER